MMHVTSRISWARRATNTPLALRGLWHFIDVHGFIVTGIVFIIMLFDTEQWRRIVPTSPHSRWTSNGAPSWTSNTIPNSGAGYI
jgi:hypothetical protein